MKFSTAGIECFLQRLGASEPPVPPDPVPITAPIPAANPTVVTVGAGNVGLFEVGDFVDVADVSGTGWAAAINGPQEVIAVGATTITLDVDTSALGGPGDVTTATITPVDHSIVGVTVAILAATNTKPVVVTVDDASGLEAGELITISGTDTSLDGRAFIADMIAGDQVTLRGSDLSTNSSIVSAGSLTGVPASDMLRFCLSSYERAVEAADAIDVSTFCGTESLAGQPLPGNVSIEGYIDYSVAAYNEWLKGVVDGQQRVFHIVLPKGIGDIVMTLTPSGITETFEVNEAAAFSAEAVINQQPVYMVS